MIAGLRCNYPKDGPGFFAGSRSDGFCRLRRNQAPLSLYAIVLKLMTLAIRKYGMWNGLQLGFGRNNRRPQTNRSGDAKLHRRF